MKINQIINEDLEQQKRYFVEIFKKFLPIAMQHIELSNLPTMKFLIDVNSPEQPTFGSYNSDTNTLQVALANRHPNDILRTIAHELVHYKQDLDQELSEHSGETGSPAENEAHAIAGIVMRHFNKKYPEYLKVKPLSF